MTKILGTLLMVATLSSVTFGQHSDIEFGYDNHLDPTEIEIELSDTTVEGFQFVESSFERLSDADPWSADEPGFATIDEDGELLRFNPGDSVFLRVLNAADHSDVGAGYVNYYNPTSATPSILEAFGGITASDSAGSTTDLSLDGAFENSGSNPQLIGVGLSDAADLGGIHDHIGFELAGDQVGAYGLLVQVETVAGPNTDVDLVSDPFWFIINRGLTEEEFDGAALSAFGVNAVPEPSSCLVLTCTLGAVLMRRRRRLA